MGFMNKKRRGLVRCQVYKTLSIYVLDELFEQKVPRTCRHGQGKGGAGGRGCGSDF